MLGTHQILIKKAFFQPFWNKDHFIYSINKIALYKSDHSEKLNGIMFPSQLVHECVSNWLCLLLLTTL